MAVISAPPLVPGDDQLLARWAKGDREALEDLFGRYRSVAYRVAYRLLGNEADALDAVQNGFVKALTHLPGFQGRSTFKTWLLRVVSNASLDFGRQRGRRESLSMDGLGAQERRQLHDALDRLPEAQRRTFVLHAEGELSYREVADILGISIGTVMSRLYYARQKLRVLLKERYG